MKFKKIEEKNYFPSKGGEGGGGGSRLGGKFRLNNKKKNYPFPKWLRISEPIL